MEFKNFTKGRLMRCGLSMACALGLWACDKDETGAVNVRVWGEGYIEEGVPAQDVEDGWNVAFTSFDVTLKDVEIAGEPVTLDEEKLDATKKSRSEEPGERGQAVGRVAVEPGRHENAAFTIVKTVVTGKAEKGDTKVSFNWTFDTPVRYTKCEARTKVKAGGESSFEITMHADHYLYNTLTGHEEPKLYFGPVANADSDKDGKITQKELEQAPIPDDFDTGSQKITNMWAWLLAQNLTIAHTDGEHHCKGSLLDKDAGQGDEEKNK